MELNNAALFYEYVNIYITPSCNILHISHLWCHGNINQRTTGGGFEGGNPRRDSGPQAAAICLVETCDLHGTKTTALSQNGPRSALTGREKKNGWMENHIQWIPHIKYHAFFFLSSTRAYCTVPQDCNGSTTVLKNMLSNQNHQNLSGPVELLVHWFGLRESGRPSWVSQSQSEGRELTNRSLDLRWAGQTSNASLKSHWWREAKRGRWRARCQTVIARDDTDGNGPRRPCPYLQLSRTPCLAGCLLGLQFHMFIYRYIYIYKYPHIRKWIWHWRQKAHS